MASSRVRACWRCREASCPAASSTARLWTGLLSKRSSPATAEIEAALVLEKHPVGLRRALGCTLGRRACFLKGMSWCPHEPARKRACRQDCRPHLHQFPVTAQAAYPISCVGERLRVLPGRRSPVALVYSHVNA